MNDETLYSLADELGQLLVAAKLVVTTVESCTGGWIAKCLTDVPGSSAWFERGFVTYSNEAKSALIGVPETVLDKHGAVSASVVFAMAEGALRNASADIAVAVSGVAGPDGGTGEKPVGTVWLAWAQRESDQIHCVAGLKHFGGDREAVRRQTVAAALEGLIALVTS